MIRGLGYAIGATIVITIFTSVAIKIASLVDINSFIDNFFSDVTTN